MARSRAPQFSLDALFFSTPTQKLMRFLLSDPSNSFTPRVLCTKLKGVRGLGGEEGILQLLEDLQALGLVDFVSNHRAVRVQEDSAAVQVLRVFTAICDLENLTTLLQPISAKGALFGDRAAGRGPSDRPYELFVLTDTPEEVKKVASRHPRGREIEMIVVTPELCTDLQRTHPSLFQKISAGIVLWG